MSIFLQQNGSEFGIGLEPELPGVGELHEFGPVIILQRWMLAGVGSVRIPHE